MDLFTKQELDAVEAVREQLRLAEEDMQRAERHKFEVWGAKLKQIRDGRWYVAMEPGCTWEQYTQERWEMTPQHAGRLIDAHEMVLNLNEALGSIIEPSRFYLPQRETHIRPLARLETPQQRAEVWQRVIANTNGHGITAKVVEAEVERFKAALDKNWITLEEWNAGERWHGMVSSSKTMNSQDDKNIEWAAWSWNPVTGCLHGCDYCYARDIANRFYPQKFQPSFIPERLAAPANTRPIKERWTGDIGYRNVFTCSMADLFGKWVPGEWIEAVLDTVRRNSQWTFLMLSKFPVRMAEFDYPPNVWLGTTVDRQWAVERAEKAFRKIKASGFEGVCWLSCEPMLERLTFGSLAMFDWVVMGGASRSSQTPEYRPPFDDIVHLYQQAREAGCQVYQKTNLIPGMSDQQRIREYPMLTDTTQAVALAKGGPMPQ